MIKLKHLTKFKTTFKLYLYVISITTFLTFINLIIDIPNKTNQIISLILLSLYTLITNIKLGKKTTDKAYKTGLKNGLITSISLIILSLITFNFTFNIKTLLFHIIIIFISILGCIIGINKKR